MNTTINRNNKDSGMDSEDDFVMVDNSIKKTESKATTPSTPAPAKKETKNNDLYEIMFIFAVLLLTFLFFGFYFECRSQTLKKENARNLETISKLQEELERLKEVEHQYIIREATRDAILESSGLSIREKQRRALLGIPDIEEVFPIALFFVVACTCGLLFTLITLPNAIVKKYRMKKHVNTQEEVPEEDEEAEDDQEEQDDDQEEQDDDQEEQDDDQEEQDDDQEEQDDDQEEQDDDNDDEEDAEENGNEEEEGDDGEEEW